MLYFFNKHTEMMQKHVK